MTLLSANKNGAAQPYVLCGTCVGIIDEVKEFIRNDGWTNTSPTKSPDFAKYRVPDLQKSGLNGCHICSIISQAVVPAHSEAQILTSSKLIVTIRIVTTHSETEDLYGAKRQPNLHAILRNEDRSRVTDNTIFISTDPGTHALEPKDAYWSFSTESDAMFNLAKEWLHDCLSDHQLCEEVRQTTISSNHSSFPEYLVCVSEDSLRLCHTQSLHTRPSYLTLSHRWGESRIFTLTSQNLSSLLCDIPFESLPKTFQDAVIITRRMGYSYIWIDSLCIIQDSREHWEQESAIMGDIYRSSAFTIAALGAINGASGCFMTRNPLCFQPYVFEAAPERLYYFWPEREKRSFEYTGYENNVEPLHERGWVIQERVLSPRTLFYGSFGMYWECVQQEASSMITKRIPVGTVKNAVHQACNLTVSGVVDDSYRAFWKWWKKIVSTYSPCGLTYRTDKLVAIQGIVKLVELKTGMHNVAGLWREYLLPELLWSPDKPTVRPLGAYQAPTWAWACLNTKVTPGIQDVDYNFNWKSKVLEADVDLVSANGQISGARIKINGPLLPVRWENVGKNFNNLRWGEVTPLWNSADDRVCFLPDVRLDPDQKLWALYIVHATAEYTYMNMGIVVTKENDGDETWIRVGSFRQYDWPSNPTTFFQDGLAVMTTLVIL